MKITFKIDPKSLFYLQQHILGKTQRIARTANDRFLQSVEQELSQKLSKKCIAYTDNANGKTRKMSLRYHHASVLLDGMVRILSEGELPLYEANRLEIVKNDLHQKLI